MMHKEVFLVLTVLFAATVHVYITNANEDDSVGCGDNAKYIEEYDVCVCLNDYRANRYGNDCIKIEDEKKGMKHVDNLSGVIKEEKTLEKEKEEEAGNNLLTLNKGRTIRLQLAENLSSQLNKTGEQVNFHVLSDIFVQGKMVIAQGTNTKGRILDAKPAKSWGKSGKLAVGIESTTAVDGSLVVLTSSISDNEDWSPMAAGGAIVGALAFGPVGLAMGGGIKGKKVDIPKGTIVTVFVAENTEINIKKDKGIEEMLSNSNEVKEKKLKAEDNEKLLKKECYDSCKNRNGQRFNDCMTNCQLECNYLCEGLTEDDWTNCLRKCSTANKEL